MQAFFCADLSFFHSFVSSIHATTGQINGAAAAGDIPDGLKLLYPDLYLDGNVMTCCDQDDQSGNPLPCCEPRADGGVYHALYG